MGWGAIVGGIGGQFVVDTITGNMRADAEAKAAEKNAALQREFAQHGIRWKVADAKKAGIHPLYALGASTHMASPVHTGSSPLADSLSGMGQNISRAIAQTSTEQEKEASALQLQSLKMDVEGKAIDNQIRSKQLQQLSIGKPGLPQDNFIPGQGNSGSKGLIKEKPLERTKTAPGHPYSEAGAVPDVGWSMGSDGRLRPIPSADVKERIEDNIFQEGLHAWRNNVMPNLGGGPVPPKSALPPGAHYWEWSYRHQGYEPRYKKYRWDY